MKRQQEGGGKGGGGGRGEGEEGGREGQSILCHYVPTFSVVIMYQRFSSGQGCILPLPPCKISQNQHTN